MAKSTVATFVLRGDAAIRENIKNRCMEFYDIINLLCDVEYLECQKKMLILGRITNCKNHGSNSNSSC